MKNKAEKMNPRFSKIYKALKAKGLSEEEEKKILSEIRHAESYESQGTVIEKLTGQTWVLKVSMLIMTFLCFRI
jgi:hypothetical protein